MSENPFFSSAWPTPFGLPPFSIIEEAHYAPALEEAIKRHRAEIEEVAQNSETPTFENTIVALEQSGRMLDRVTRVFWILGGTDLTEGLKDLRKHYGPILTQHEDSIVHNRSLFERIEQIYEQRESLGLSPEQSKLVHDYYDDFVRAGATLSGESRTRLKELNTELTKLFEEFSNRALEANRKLLVIESEADLAGLPDEVRQAAAALATERNLNGKWAFGLVRSSYEPFMKFAENRAQRKALWTLFHERGSLSGPQDTRPIILKIAKLRAERAKLFGFPNHAAYQIDGLMAKTPGAVYALLTRLLTGASARIEEDRAELQKLLNQDLGSSVRLEPWDWRFYAERLRRERYNLREEVLKPYFELDSVRNGAFLAATKLFGISFSEVTDRVTLHHPEAKAFDVVDLDNRHLGLLVVDYFPRESKRSGAWCTAFRSQSNVMGDHTRPIVLNVGNFPAPAPDAPALLGWTEVQTLFHEFGHALHTLLSDVTYPRFSGTRVKRDYVEFPSQMMENWASVPEVLKSYAKHYKTGEPIPDDLIKKLQETSTFNEGFSTGEYVAAALLDLEWHTRDVEQLASITDINAFDRQTMKKIGMVDEIAPRYYSPYFQHIFSSDGYASGYYVYAWSDVLSADAFKAFQDSGNVFNPQLAERLREFVFSAGSSAPEMEMYVKFRGRKPSVDALLQQRGLQTLD